MTDETFMMDDRTVVKELLLRNQKVTRKYLYIKCYPLFKAIYDNYYTDCQSCVEFINEIYLHLMMPNRDTGECKLQSFHFGSTLTTWLKTVSIYYCYMHFRRRQKVKMVEHKIEMNEGETDRFDLFAASMYDEQPTMSYDDMEAILALMPNKRYSMLMRLRYIECFSNEETAEALQMTMSNYYNKHLRAKMQFNEILKKEQTYEKRI